MNFYKQIFAFTILAFSFRCAFDKKTEQSVESGYGLTPVPFNEVTLEDKFWKPRLKTQMETLVPFALDKTIPAQIALKQAGDFLAGLETELPRPHRYQSSDLYKVMEGAAYLLHDQENPALEQRMDSIIDIIASAQNKDGYLYVPHLTGVAQQHKTPYGRGGMGERPYSYVLHSHELYNIGHMYEGAVAYYRATGKDKWLKVAEKNAQHLNKVFFEGDPNYNDGKPVNQAPGHQELELALIKLYRVTDNKLYLQMAKKFLDIRGITLVPDGEGTMSASYAQQHRPVAEQRQAIGHAVRATYLYSGMADVGALTRINDYDEALESIWHNIVDKKISITGGLGAVHGIEGFGPEYVLPNKEVYNETCAAVGNVFFNFRMFLMTKDARYMDMAEVSLLNNSLAGVNIEGNKFFYVNPLEADGSTPFNHGRVGRSPWFGTACCPSNIARLIPQVSGMMYSYSGDDLYTTFYGSSNTTISLASGKIAIRQESDYPFDGVVKLTLSPESDLAFSLKLRIPTWARTNQFMPGKLYDYIDKNGGKWTVAVNGEKVDATVKNGFATVNRTWSVGDVVELHIPMPIRFNTTIQQVVSNRGRVAVTRGPLVYAAEGIDNNGVVQRFFLNEIPGSNHISEEVIADGLLQNVVKVKLPAKELKNEGVGKHELQLIPYYAWNNREEGSMIIWLADSEENIQLADRKTARGGKYKSVSASSTGNLGSLMAISDPRRPGSSVDQSIQPWISENDGSQWIVVELKEAQQIRSIGLYWFTAPKRKFNTKVPASWEIQYKDGNSWKNMPLYVTDDYSLDTDEYNVVHPALELTTREIRILINPQKGSKAGILDVDIEFEDMPTS